MIVARYTSNVSGYVPTFNNGYAYSVNEQLNNGVYTVEIESDTDFSSVMFGTDGDNAVTSLLSVEYLKITNKVYNLQKCFRRCTNVTSINTDGWDTSNVTSLQATFAYCSKLTSLDVSKWDTKNVTILHATFSGCSALTTLDVSGWNTRKVTILQTTFYDCSKLTSLDLSGWDTGKVTSLYSTFYGCSKLTSLDVSEWDTSNVITLQSTFQNCSALTSLDVSGWDIGKVTTLYVTFAYCSALTSLDLSGWDTSNVDNLNSTFYGCSKLTSLYVSGWDIGKVTNLGSTFQNCSALTSLDLSGWDTKNVTNLYQTFYNCSVKSIGVLYCSDDTITTLANAITTQCDFYLDRININSPNSLVNFIEYKECKKEAIYYDSEDNSWKKPVLREWDSIEKHTDGKYYYHKRSGEVVLDGSENWSPNSVNTIFYNNLKISDIKVPTSNNLNDYIPFICDRLTPTNIDAIYNNTTIVGIAISKDRNVGISVNGRDLNTFKAWLQANPTTVVYQLAEEKVYECTNLDLITYQNETNLMVESGAIPHKTTLKDHRNIANITTILQEKVDVLENNVNTMNSEIDSDIANLNTEIETINNTMNTEIDNINTDLIGVSESIEGSWLSVDSKDGYLKIVEILGNTIQDANNLADIRSVGDKVENQELYEIPVLSTGKNLFDKSNANIGYIINQNTGEILADTTNGNCSSDYIRIFADKKYSYNKRNSGGVGIYDLNKNFVGFTSLNNAGITNHSFGVDGYIRLNIGKDVLDTFQLEEGTVVTPYEPYQEDKLTILSLTPLEKVGNIADRIICKDGVWGVEKNVKQYDTSNIVFNKVTEFDYRHTLTDLSCVPQGGLLVCISDKYVPGTTLDVAINKNEGITIYKHNDTKYEVIIYDKTDTVEDINNKMKNSILKYGTNQPQFIPLPHNQQIKLRTFASKTNISFGCEIETTLKASVPKSIGASVSSNTTQIDNYSKELQKINNLEESVTSEVVSESGFACIENASNGYFEDVKLDGRTLVNLAMPVMLNGATNLVRRDLNNSPITICCNILNSTTQFNGRYIFTDDTKGNDFKIASNGEIGFKSIFLNFDNVPADKIVKGIAMYKVDSSSSLNVENLLILEGDHTQNPPSYFDGLKSVGQDVDEISVLSHNENLFDGVWVDKYISSTGVQQHISYVGTDYIDVIPSKTYTINCGIESINYFDKSKNYIGKAEIPSNFYNLDSVTFTTPTNCRYIACRQYLSSSTVLSLEEINKLNIQIKQGNTADVFIKHRENKKRILYYNDETQTWEKPILRQWDSIEKHADGKYYYHKRSGEVVLNGSEEYQYYSYGGFGISINDLKKNNNSGDITNAICDRYNAVSYDDISVKLIDMSFSSHYTVNNIVFRNTTCTDVAGFKAWLQTYPTTVVYQLAEEKVYECTDLDLITFLNETNFLVKSGALNPKVSLKVSNGVGNVVTLLQNKITVLEQMVYNLMKMLNSQQSNIDE